MEPAATTAGSGFPGKERGITFWAASLENRKWKSPGHVRIRRFATHVLKRESEGKPFEGVPQTKTNPKESSVASLACRLPE